MKMKNFIYLLTTGLSVFGLMESSANAVCLGGTPDGMLAPTEECDDNNAVDGDGCQADCTVTTDYSCVRNLDFANLSNNDYPGGAANWIIAGDNLSGTQTVNISTPSVALFGEDSQIGTYSTNLAVNSNVDDDFIGFALGFNPGDEVNPAADWLVIDWKQLAQNNAKEGMFLSHVKGADNTGISTQHAIPERLCASGNAGPPSVAPCVTELAAGNNFGATGWVDMTTYSVQITYRPTSLVVIIDGQVEFNVTPSDFPNEFAGNVFPAGQMGFYTLSQPDAFYENLAPFGPSICNIAMAGDGNISVATGSGPATFPTGSNFTDPDGDMFNPSSVLITNRPPDATVTVSPNGDIVVTPDDDSVSGTYVVEYLACDDDPIVVDCDTGTVTVTYGNGGAACGNGTLEAGEGCDDGNLAAGDGCNALCLVEDGAACNDDTVGIVGAPGCATGFCDTSAGTPGTCGDPNLDTDGDGIPDVTDVDDDDDGILDVEDGPGDTDGDGIADSVDLDSDNDGILDVVEGQSGCADSAPADGLCDGPDADGDGHADDATEAAPDTDRDGAPDFQDLDSDNDGIPDTIEGGSGCVDAAPLDAVCDGPDTDGDGIVDGVDDAPTFGATPAPELDTDGDGVPDYLDLDSDNDGLLDVVEGGSGCEDSGPNGVCDIPDADGDGIVDSIDDLDGFGDTAPTTPPDTDGAGDGPDFQDTDSNDDGTNDVDGADCTNDDGDDVCDGDDSDDDGIVDSIDNFNGHGAEANDDGSGAGDGVLTLTGGGCSHVGFFAGGFGSMLFMLFGITGLRRRRRKD